ncbi:recombination regulator RecX [Streptomyces sp. MBT65]|uniref:recombination regulator RecX n=1 Tax=Streptomyces sp. MBT65 TaxID=1488395 RepID=UPI00190DF38C|nr:recombination regulator RecX [Streptomyces sp. MBT65]MBK3578691.1 recombination regulator RecX [Streptomyces sp. MBT65]
MTRRTDWAEYAYPGAPQGRGGGGDGPAYGADGGPEEPYGTDGPYGDEPGGEWSAGGFGGFAGETGPPFGGPEPGDGSAGTDRLFRSSAPGGMSPGDPGEGSAADDAPGRGSRRSRGARGEGDSQGSTARGDGARGRRGRRGRGRGFGESSGEDGGDFSSSRAEKEEPPADPAERARGICLRLLTGNPRTRKQLADALRKREIPDEVADEVLSRFEEVGLINDGAFADAWVESRHHGRGLARRALAQELRTKGVDSTLIDEAVSQLDPEQEETTARELVDRKLRSTQGLDRDKRLRRLAGMLARKGYSQGMALRVVRQALEEEGEDTEFLGDEGY